MKKVKSIFELTTNAKPAVLVCRGNVSLGINHPTGPRGHAKEETNTDTSTTTPFERGPVADKLVAKITSIIT